MGNSFRTNSCCLISSIKKNEVVIRQPGNNISYIIKIQSFYRGYQFRRKISPKLIKLGINLRTNNQQLDSTSSQNADSHQIKEVGLNYNTIYLESNPKIKILASILPKFHLDEKENYQITTSNMQNTGLLYSDNSLYKGTINQSGKREGFGKYYLANGSIYEGFFKDNKMEGRGRMLNIEGFVYEGNFHNSQANGYGKLISLDGTIYKGNWLNDKQNGIGYQIYPDKSYYVGNFINGSKNGKGTMYFKEGHVYEGNFYDNEIKGEGIRRWKDGRIYNGQWDNNKMNGYGIFFWPDKKKYYGHYIDDNKDGFGIFYWNTDKKFEGIWKNGKQEGYGIIYRDNGNNIQYGFWEDGRIKRVIDIDNLQEVSEVVKCIDEMKHDFEYLEFLKKIDRYEKGIGLE